VIDVLAALAGWHGRSSRRVLVELQAGSPVPDTGAPDPAGRFNQSRRRLVVAALLLVSTSG
jgi:hypothetical protein